MWNDAQCILEDSLEQHPHIMKEMQPLVLLYLFEGTVMYFQPAPGYTYKEKEFLPSLKKSMRQKRVCFSICVVPVEREDSVTHLEIIYENGFATKVWNAKYVSGLVLMGSCDTELLDRDQKGKLCRGICTDQLYSIN